MISIADGMRFGLGLLFDAVIVLFVMFVLGNLLDMFWWRGE